MTSPLRVCLAALPIDYRGAQVISPGVRPTTVALKAFVGEQVSVWAARVVLLPPTVVPRALPTSTKAPAAGPGQRSGVVLPVVNTGARGTRATVSLHTSLDMDFESHTAGFRLYVARCACCARGCRRVCVSVG